MSRLRIAVSLAVAGWVIGQSGALAQDAAPPGLAVMQAPLEKSRAAIEACRERRQRKEISTYKESAECSNPKIFAAWRDANYPHMDLITEWLNVREAESEKVDQKVITPEQFERDMEALTVRLTAEERRRRAGLLETADGTLQLQLPAAAQVVGVATPKSQDKLAAKKGAAARLRAANAPDAASTDIAATASLASLNASAPESGVGGPFVPVPPNSPAARAAMAAAAPGEGSSGLYAQLASQRSEANARLAFRSLQTQYPNILGGRDAVIRRAGEANDGNYYRVEIGPLTGAQADELCGSLKAAGALCVPRYE